MDRANVFHSSPPLPSLHQTTPLPSPRRGKKKKTTKPPTPHSKTSGEVAKEEAPRCLRIPRRAGGGGAGGAPRPLRAGPGRAGAGAAAAHLHRPSFGVGTPHCALSKNNIGERRRKIEYAAGGEALAAAAGTPTGSARRGDVSCEAGARPSWLMLLLPLPSTPPKKNSNPTQGLCSFPTAIAIPTGNFHLSVSRSTRCRRAGSAPGGTAPGPRRGRHGRLCDAASPGRRGLRLLLPPRPCPEGPIGPGPPSSGLPGHRLPLPWGSGPAALPTAPLSGSLPLPQRVDTLSPAAKCPCGLCGWILIVTAKTVTFLHLLMDFPSLSFLPGLYREWCKP